MENKSPINLVVSVNNVPMLEYDRSKTISDEQNKSLQLMQEKLDDGLELNNELIQRPTPEQCIQFVSANLVSAILNDEESLAAASCSYIAHVLPELKQIKAVEHNGEIGIELIFDREYQPEEKLNFTPIDKITSRSH